MAESPSTKAAAPPSKRPTLVPQGEHAGKPSMPLGAHLFTMIGSRNRAHLHLLSSTISRNHAGIVTGKSGVYIRDLASRNGIIVNGRKLRESELQDGDLVQLGSFKFKFQEPPGPTRVGAGSRPPLAMIEMDGGALTPMDARTILIGRRPGSDIILDSPAVSNTHAIIFDCDGKRFVRDLGSRTGTQINGKTIHQQAIEIGDQIKIGSTTFRYIAADMPTIEDAEDVGAIPLNAEPGPLAEASAAPADLDFEALIAEEPAEMIERAEDDLPLVEPASTHTDQQAQPLVTGGDEEIDFAPSHPAAEEPGPIPVEEEIPLVHDEAPPPVPDAAEPAEPSSQEVWKPQEQQAVTADLSAVAEPELASEEPVITPEPVNAEPEVSSLESTEAAPEPDLAELAEAAADPPEEIPDAGIAMESSEQPQPQAAESLAVETESPAAFDADAPPADDVQMHVPVSDDSALQATVDPTELQPIVSSESDEPEVPDVAASDISVPEPEAGFTAADLPASSASVDSTEAAPEISPAAEIPVEQAIVTAEIPVGEFSAPADVADADLASQTLAEEASEASVLQDAPPQAEPEPAPLADSVAEPLDQPTVEQEAEQPPAAKRPARSSRRKSGSRKRRTNSAEVSDVVPAAPEQDLSSSTAEPHEIGEPPTELAELEAAASTEAWAQPAKAAAPDPDPETSILQSVESAAGTTNADSAVESESAANDFDRAPEPLAAESDDRMAGANPTQTESVGEPLPLVELDTAALPAIYDEATPESDARVAGEIQPQATTHPDLATPPEDDAVSSSEPAVETIEPTQPTLESALDLEPTLSELVADPDPAEMNSAEALLSDSAFGEVVTDYASRASGPLVEESNVAPPTVSPTETTVALPQAPSQTLDPLGDSDLPPLELGESLVFGDEVRPAVSDEEPAVEEITPEHRVVTDLTPGTIDDLEFTAPVGMEPELGLQPVSDLGGEIEGPVVEAPSFDAGLEWEEPLAVAPLVDEMGLDFEESGTETVPADFLVPETSSVPQEATPISEAEPPAPQAEAPSARPRPSLSPFFGMERDLGSFIGGMPLTLNSAAADTIPTAPAAPRAVDRPAAEPQQAQTVNASSTDDLEFEKLFDGEEPLELFDETADQLDNLPDSLDPISDVGSVIGEPTASSAEPKVSVAPAPALRSLTADASAVAPKPPAQSVSIPPFAGASGRATRPGANPFAKLSGLRATDVFSQTAFAPMDEPATKAPPMKPQPIDAGPVNPTKASGRNAAPLPGSDSAGPPFKTDADAIASAPPPPRPVAPRPTAAMLNQQRSQKRPWWKNIRFLLPLLLVLIAAAVFAIIRFVAPKTMVQGTLQFKGIEDRDVGVYARREQVNRIRQMLQRPSLREAVLQRLKSEGIAAGFVQNRQSLDELAEPSRSPFQEDRLLLQRPQIDPQDPQRMRDILQTVYLESRTAAEKADQVRLQATAATENLQALSNRIKTEQDELNKTADRLKAAGGTSTSDLLADPIAAVQKLERQDAQLSGALAQAKADRKKAHDTWEQAQDAGQQGTAADPTIAQIRQKLSSLKNQLIVARLSGGPPVDPAKGFDNAMGEVEGDLTSIAAANPRNPILTGYVDRARRATADIREAREGQKQDAARIEDLRQQIAAHREAHLRQVWTTDETLKGLLGERDAQAHRLAGASDNGYTQDAARIRGVLDELDQKIEARRQSLATDAGSSDELQQKLDQAIGQLQEDRHDRNAQITTALGRLDLPPAGKLQPSDEHLLDTIGLEVAKARAEHEKYLNGPRTPANDTDAQVQKLQFEVAEQQAQLDAYEQRNDIKAAASPALAALDAAQAAEAKAQAACAANLNELTIARKYRDEQMRVSDSVAARDTASNDAQAKAAEAGSTPVLIPPDAQNSVQSVSQPDQRVWYMAGAIGLIVLVFAGPLWLSLRSTEDQIPYAAIKRRPAVVEDDEHFPSMDDDEHPALT